MLSDSWESPWLAAWFCKSTAMWCVKDSKKKKKKYNTKFKIIKYIYNKCTTLLLVKNYNGLINKIHCLQNNNKIAFI